MTDQQTTPQTQADEAQTLYDPTCQYCAHWHRDAAEAATACRCPQTKTLFAKPPLANFGCIYHAPLKTNAAEGRPSPLAYQRMKIWEDIDQSYIDDSYRTEEMLKSKWLCDAVLSKYQFTELLEMGCGTGRNLYVLNEKRPEVHLWGCDISWKAMKMSRAKIPKRIALKKASVYTTPFVTQSFDMVLIVSVHMFVPPGSDLAMAVAEAKRLSKRYICQIEWCREGQPDKHLTWNRSYAKAYEPEFKCIESHSLSHAYTDKDIPLMLWIHERQK